jgi:hypothetical protein
MSRSEEMSWHTISVTSIAPGIEVAMTAVETGEGVIVLPAIAILHQSRETPDSIEERIVLGILNLDSGEIVAVEPENVGGIDVPWLGDEDDSDDTVGEFFGEAGIQGFSLGESDS